MRLCSSPPSLARMQSVANGELNPLTHIAELDPDWPSEVAPP